MKVFLGISSYKVFIWSHLSAIREMDLSELREGYTRLQETPFSGETKSMAVKCEARSSGQVTYFLKGAPERISAACREDSELLRMCRYRPKLGWNKVTHQIVYYPICRVISIHTSLNSHTVRDTTK